jgi:hypothetical protein
VEHQSNRIIIVGGPKRGKSTLGQTLSEEHRLTHLCTDPQKMLPLDMNGTPNHLRYSGEGGVGEWVAREWIGRDRTLIEGVKAIDALRRALASGCRSSEVCDRLIVLTERLDEETLAERVVDIDEYRKQEQQATHTMAVLEQLEDQLDNLEHWLPIDGEFVRSSC